MIILLEETVKFVVVAWLVVALIPVKFWKVEEPLDQRFANSPRPADITEVGMISPRVIVRLGVAPPDEEPDTPLAVVTPIAVTVPCGWAVQVKCPPVKVMALVPVHVESPNPVIDVPKKFVVEAVVANKLVVVAALPVALPKRSSARLALVLNRLVEEARLAKKFVVVAEVPVAVVKVKLRRVEEAVIKMPCLMPFTLAGLIYISVRLV